MTEQLIYVHFYNFCLRFRLSFCSTNFWGTTGNRIHCKSNYIQPVNLTKNIKSTDRRDRAYSNYLSRETLCVSAVLSTSFWMPDAKNDAGCCRSLSTMLVSRLLTHTRFDLERAKSVEGYFRSATPLHLPHMRRAVCQRQLSFLSEMSLRFSCHAK